MGCCNYCVLTLALLLPLISLGLTLASLLTDYWFIVEPGTSSSKAHDYHYGVWRNCTNNGGKSCIYRDWLPDSLSNLTTSETEYFALEMSYVCFLIGCGAMQLGTIMAIICGLMPCKDTNPVRRTKMFLVAAIMLMFAAIFGMVSGICFIALRDIDSSRGVEEVFPAGLDLKYGYSFMFAWGATGVCLVNGFLYLHLLRTEYEDFPSYPYGVM